MFEHVRVELIRSKQADQQVMRIAGLEYSVIFPHMLGSSDLEYSQITLTHVTCLTIGRPRILLVSDIQKDNTIT